MLGKFWLVARIVFFFHLTCLGWLIFRARSVGQIFAMGSSLLDVFVPSPDAIVMAVRLILFTLPLVVIQIYQYRRSDLLVVLKMKVATRAVLYCVMYYFFLIYGVTGGNEFIYFQF